MSEDKENVAKIKEVHERLQTQKDQSMKMISIFGF